MPYAENFTSDVILTVGCAGSLFLTGRAAEILSVVKVSVFFSEIAYQDNCSITVEENREYIKFPLRHWLDPLVAEALVTRVELKSDDEWTSFWHLTCNPGPQKQRVRASVEVLARHRSWLVGCDDLSTMKRLDSQQPPGYFVSAIDFVKAWAEERRVDPDEIGHVLMDMQNRADYTPYSDHPNYQWWLQHMRLKNERDA